MNNYIKMFNILCVRNVNSISTEDQSHSDCHQEIKHQILDKKGKLIFQYAWLFGIGMSISSIRL